VVSGGDGIQGSSTKELVRGSQELYAVPRTQCSVRNTNRTGQARRTIDSPHIARLCLGEWTHA